MEARSGSFDPELPLILEPRFSHALQVALHQLARLVGYARSYPIDRQLGLLALHRCKKRTGFVDTPRLGQARTAQTLRSLKTRAQSQSFRRVFGRFCISPSSIVSNRDGPEEQRHLRIQGTEPDGILPMLDRLAIPSRKSEAAAQMGVGGGRIRVEIDRPAERREIDSSVRLSIMAQ